MVLVHSGPAFLALGASDPPPRTSPHIPPGPLVPILTATNLKHTFGHRPILEGVSMAVEPGERIGVVGRNGAGKSTLLKALGGLLTADHGTVVLAKGCRAGYLHQDPKLDPTETLRGAAEAAFERLHALHQQLDRVFEQMASAEGPALERLMRRQADLEHEMEAAGGYAVDHKIDAVLHGLGFKDSQFSVKVAGLSGGQKGRLALARLLLEDPDVLLLDEPTNHLDLDGRLWLESFLRDQFKGAVLLISHDRYLLDNVVTRIVEVEQGRLIDYPGNYEDFREIRAMRRLTQLRAYQNEQSRFKKEEAFIRRYRAGQRAKQAQGRLSKLERAKEESTLERPMEAETFDFEFPPAPRSGDMVFSARELGKSYTAPPDPAEGFAGGTKVLFHDLDLTVSRGERWGIIGPNGAGKSTLVRCLLGETPVDKGTARKGANLIVGFYKQTHDHVPADPPVFRYLQDVILKENPGLFMGEQQARNLAGAFLFSGPEQDRPMGQLSGGERSRVLLAALLASAKNLLILDEPTNHLDISAAERLEMALAKAIPETDESPGSEGGGYEGTLLLISHDRALIDACCDHLLILDGQGNAEVFVGNYTEWAQKKSGEAAKAAAREAEEKARKEAAERARRDAEERKKQQQAEASKREAPRGNGATPLARLKTDQLERKIAELESRLRDLDTSMEDPDVWKDGARAKELADERARTAAELTKLEEEYFRRG